MRLFPIALAALLLLAAGCANQGPSTPTQSPSSQVGQTPSDSGWSVAPGQRDARNPAAPGADQAQAGSLKAPEDEATLAAADRRAREEAARRARAGLNGDAVSARPQEQATRSTEPAVKPIVPAFPVRMQENRVAALRTVHFAFDVDTLSAEARSLLDQNALWLKANPVSVQVGGHADERGSPEYNLALGERRAKRVREYLIEHGVPADNLTTVSYGEEMPIANGHDEAAWSQNRRAEFRRADGRQISDANAAQPRG